MQMTCIEICIEILHYYFCKWLTFVFIFQLLDHYPLYECILKSSWRMRHIDVADNFRANGGLQINRPELFPKIYLFLTVIFDVEVDSQNFVTHYINVLRSETRYFDFKLNSSRNPRTFVICESLFLKKCLHNKQTFFLKSKNLTCLYKQILSFIEYNKIVLFWHQCCYI